MNCILGIEAREAMNALLVKSHLVTAYVYSFSLRDFFIVCRFIKIETCEKKAALKRKKAAKCCRSLCFFPPIVQYTVWYVISRIKKSRPRSSNVRLL